MLLLEPLPNPSHICPTYMNGASTTANYTLSLHDALPIFLAREVVARELVGRAHRAMVRVVEERPERSSALSSLSDRRDERRLVPFVDQHQIDAGEGLVEIEGFRAVTPDVERRVGASHLLERRFAVVSDEVRDAPRVPRLEAPHRATARDELGDDAPQKMRVPVVPVAQERV